MILLEIEAPLAIGKQHQQVCSALAYLQTILPNQTLRMDPLVRLFRGLWANIVDICVAEELDAAVSLSQVSSAWREAVLGL